MKTLFLARHAKSSWGDMSLGDEERPLNRRGRRDAPEMGRWLAAQPQQPERVISSPAKRALQTARLLAGALSIPADEILLEPDLYFQGLPGMLRVLQSLADDSQRIMLVGHNPVMTELFNRLAREQLGNFPTCAIGIIRFPVESWGLADTAPGELIALQTPKRLAAG